MVAALEQLEALLEHRFRDRDLLRRALTHKSYSYEKQLLPVLHDNEQLEFLGDAVLGLVAGEFLLSRFPDLPEGRLTPVRARLVSASHLFTVGQALGLGEYLQLGRGEEHSGGRTKRKLLANAVEALIAAVYLDAGLEAARTFILQHVLAPGMLDGAGEPAKLADFKTALQEYARARGLPQPQYVTIAERGPEDSKRFVMEVRIGAERRQAEGPSKKNAGQKAAEQLLQALLDRSEAAAGLSQP